MLALLPTVWWNVKFGPRLLGHLKLIQFTLDNTCKAISKLKVVEYTGRPYDKDGNHFIGDKAFRDPVLGNVNILFDSELQACSQIRAKTAHMF